MTTQKRKNDQFSPVNPVVTLLDSLLRGAGQLVTLSASGIWWIVSNLLRGAWWLIRQAASGAWWLLNRGIRNASRALLWLVMRPWYILRYLLNGHVPAFENARQEEIFWRIKRRHRRRRLFLLNSLIYSFWLMLAGIILVSELRSGYLSSIVPVSFITVGWMLALIGHFYFNRLGEDEDRELGEAMEREYDRSTRLVETYEEYADGRQIVDEIVYHEKRKRLEDR